MAGAEDATTHTTDLVNENLANINPVPKNLFGASGDVGDVGGRAPTDAKIMLVDDEHINLLLLERILRRAGYDNLCSVEDPREALEAFQTFSPDLIVTDLHMPHINGIELIERLNARIPADAYLPIVMLTADLNPDLEQRALLGGAKDFFNKPFKANQITLRLRNLLQTRALHEALRRQNNLLETRVTERTAELEAAHLEGLERLALAADYRDHDTGLHTQRVGRLSARIARKLGFSEHDAVVLERAAPLHDVGKIGIPDSILLKPGRLDEAEFSVMKQHVKVGATLLSNGRSELIKMAACVALTHHERWDGSGYPNGLTKSAIPLVGQIVAVADVFDTLVNKRPYKNAWPVELAVAEVQAKSGSWFNPQVVAAFLYVLADMPELLSEQDAALEEF